MTALVGQASGLPIDKVTMALPFDPKRKLRNSAYSALRITPVHARRHLWQAERIESKVR